MRNQKLMVWHEAHLMDLANWFTTIPIPSNSLSINQYRKKRSMLQTITVNQLQYRSGDGDDMLAGRGGKDRLVGGSGSDTYYIRKESGTPPTQTIIVETWQEQNFNRIELTGEINADDLRLAFDEHDLLLQYSNQGDTIRFAGFAPSPAPGMQACDLLYSTTLALIVGSAMACPTAFAQSVVANGNVLPGVPAPPLTLWQPNNLRVGVNAAGTLSITDGGVVAGPGQTLLGANAGSHGTVTVSGAGSSLSTALQMQVGSSGNGVLTIEDGGAASIGTFLYIGRFDGAEGLVTVSGAGSSLTSNNMIQVGSEGKGTLIVEDGATVNTTNVARIGLSSTGIGDATIRGAGSSWITNNSMTVGHSGTGTLTIENGAVVSNVAGFVGREVGSTGEATVSGAGSTWSNSSFLHIGDAGTGTLTVEGGGTVSSTEGRIGNSATGVGEVTVTGAGSDWNTGGNFYIGGSGSGALTIANGGSVESSGATIGQLGSGVGVATVTDAGSAWNINGDFYIGEGGNGALTIANGGSVEGFGTVNMGASGSGVGAATVTGAGSVWDMSYFSLGQGGSSTLTIADGGTVHGMGGYFGMDGGVSNITVTGAGSTLTFLDNTYHGAWNDGQSTLTIANGGSVRNHEAAMGGGPGSVGVVTVTGAGSTWSTDDIHIGHEGSGTLTIADGGHVAVDPGQELNIGRYAGSNGILNIGAAAGDAATAAGTLAADLIQFGDGNGTLNFNHTDSAYVFSSAITSSGSGPGAINQLAGTTILTGNSSGFNGTTTVANGSLIVGQGGTGSLGGTVNVLSGGVLGGSGTVGSTGTTVTVANGGTLSAGNSIGTLTVAGNLMLNTGSILDYELGTPGSVLGSGTSDHITVGGHLTLDGVVNLSDAGGAGLGYYRLMSYGSLTDNGLGIGTTPTFGTSSYEILTGSGFVDLLVGAAGDADLQIWQGGNGVWNATHANWLNQGAEFPTTWASNHGAFTGAGGLVEVEGTQNFKGLQFVSGGYELTGDGTLQTVAGGSELRVLSSVAASIGTEISGPGGIVKTQGGTLTLTGTNTYVGGTTVENGVLLVAVDSALGQADGGLLLNGGVFQVTGDAYQSTDRAVSIGANGGGFDIASAGNAFTIGQGIVGDGDLYKLGLGTLALTGTNIYGTAFISQGTLQAGTANTFAASSAHIVDTEAVLDLDGFDQTIGSLTGAGNVTLGAGTLTTGGNGGDTIFSGSISGAGGLIKDGSGTFTFAGNSSYAGDTVIAGGVLQLGNGGTAGSVSSDIQIDGAGALHVDRSSDWNYAGLLSGNGAFNHLGSGTTTLTGDSAGFTGTTTVANGSLIVGQGGTGALGGTINVLDGAMLGGSGTVGSVGTAVTVADGGILAPGNGVGTLTVAGDLFLNAGSILDYELGAPGSILGSGTSDHITVGGHLTLDGVVNLSDAGGASLGYYRLMTYGGLTDNGLGIGTIPSLGSGSYQIMTGGGSVDLLVGAAGDADLQIWQGGNGIWNATNANWLNQGAEFPTIWASNHGAFTGAGGFVEVEGNQSFKGLQVVTNGYELAGDGTIETIAGGSELRVLSDVSATIGTEISGPGGIVKTQGGTLVLTGNNSYAGGTTVEYGVLSVAADGALGHTDGSLTLNGGIFRVTGDAYQSMERAVSVGANGGGFDIASAANVFTLGQGIAGTGDLYKLGLGTLTLTDTNSYGDAFISQGTLRTGTTGTLSAASAHTVEAGAVINLDGFDQTIGSLSGAGSVMLGSGTLTLGGNDSDTTFSGAIAGMGGIVKNGDGTFILAGTNSYSGNTAIADGVLQLGNGGTTGSIISDVEIGATGALRVDRSSDWSYTGLFSGIGAFDHWGGGTTSLTGDSSGFAGTTTVANGSLIVGQGGIGALGGTINVLDGAMLGGSGIIGSVGTAVTVADGGILAPGNGVGTLTVAGDLVLNAGSILDYELGAPASALGGGTSDHITVGGHLTLDGVVNLSDSGGAGLGYYRLMSYGSLTNNGLGIGVTPALGTSSYEILTGSGFVDLLVGAAGDADLQIWQGGSGVWNATNANWLNQGAEFPTIWASNHGAFTGVGGLVEVEGNQSFKGLQFVTGGYELAGDGALQTVEGGSELRVLSGVAASIGTEISGPGGIVKTQGGTLVLSGSNTYVGGTTVKDGVLSVAADNALGHADGGLFLNGGVFQVTGDAYQFTDRAVSIGANGGGFDIASAGNAFTIGQGITGDSDLYKLGAGTLVLTNANTYSGNTTVSAGVLQLGNGGTTGSVSSDIQIDGAGRLRVNRSNGWTYGGTLSGTGAFDQFGSGTTTLTSDSSGFAGTTTVTNGSLIVGQGGTGALGGTVNVLSGGVLGGSGTVGSAGTAVTIAAGGVHAPGIGLGQQTILGDYMLRGTLQMGGTPTGTDTLIGHGGIDIVGSTLDVQLSPTTAKSWNVINGPFTIIDNRGSNAVNGTFATVNNNLLFLDPHLDYAGGDGNDVTLDLVRNDVAFASVALTPNQAATGRAIDTLPFRNPVWNKIALMSDENAVRRSFDLLSGEIHAASLGVFLEESRFPRIAVNDQLRAVSRTPANTDTVVWGHGYGSWADWQGDGNAASLKRNTGGLLLGLDGKLGDWRVGVMTGWNRTDVSVADRASSAEAETWHAGIYGGTQWDKLGLRLGLLHGEHSIETRRTVSIPGLFETLRAAYDARTSQAFGELTYTVNLNPIHYEPFVNLAHIRTRSDGFAETGGDAVLASQTGTMSATVMTVGQRIEGAHDLNGVAVKTNGMIGWQHLFGDVAPFSTHSFSAGNAFTIAGTPLASDSLLVEAGLEASLSKTATIGANYTGRLAQNGEDHAVTLSLRVGF
jgi:fibronectin-binding autotransporter adhesin